MCLSVVVVLLWSWVSYNRGGLRSWWSVKMAVGVSVVVEFGGGGGGVWR